MENTILIDLCRYTVCGCVSERESESLSVNIFSFEFQRTVNLSCDGYFFSYHFHVSIDVVFIKKLTRIEGTRCESLSLEIWLIA